MAHYILIDNHSGYIFADTRDLPGYSDSDHGPADAARLLEAQLKEGESDWSERGFFSRPASNEDGYFVFRIDNDGSEAVPVVRDGQDKDTIEAVERSCRPWCFLARVERDPA